MTLILLVLLICFISIRYAFCCVQLQAVAVDISQEACQLTRLNAQLTGTSARLKILHGDIAASAGNLNNTHCCGLSF